MRVLGVQLRDFRSYARAEANANAGFGPAGQGNVIVVPPGGGLPPQQVGQQPAAGNAPEKPLRSFRLHVYGLYPVSEKNPAESGRLDYVKEVTDPAGINGNWQAVDGGFCFLTGDGKLRMISGAADAKK